MKTIPSICIRNNSAAEERVFKLLREARFSPDDVAIHSLNVGIHENKVWGEADFVIACERGVVLLEVKGGGVACVDGIWEFTNAHGQTNRKYESPAAQARSVFYSLKEKYIDKSLPGLAGRHSFGWGCIFPDIDWIGGKGEQMPELPPEVCAFKEDCVGPQKFKAWLERLFDHWDGAFERSGRGRPTKMESMDIKRVSNALRPNFEKFPSLDTQLAAARSRLCELTDEQYESFDEISENDRIMVLGGAGTGKTFLAMAGARYEAAQGKRVVFTTRNELLSKFVAQQDIEGQFVSLPFEQLSRLGDKACDVLLIDEGQDLCQLSSLDAFNSVLKGGLDSGRWRWFGDPNWQVAPHYGIEEEAIEYLRSVAFTRRLRKNVRNAPPIVDAIVEYVAADLGDPKAMGLGPVFRVLRAKDEDDRVGIVANEVCRWVREGAERSEIAVLVGNRADCASLASAISSRGQRAEQLSTKMFSGGPRKSVAVSEIEHFKGLERPLVCVASLGDVEDLDKFKRRIYLAFSRANHTLTAVCNLAEMNALENLRNTRRN